MAAPFTVTRRVEFADTDAAGIAHFAAFFRYMEEAEHALYRSLGFSVHTQVAGVPISFPRVEAQCRYLKPLFFEDEVKITVRVEEVGEKTLTHEFAFVRPDGEEAARGRLTVICARVDGDAPRAVPIPAAITEKLESL